MFSIFQGKPFWGCPIFDNHTPYVFKVLLQDSWWKRPSIGFFNVILGGLIPKEATHPMARPLRWSTCLLRAGVPAQRISRNKLPNTKTRSSPGLSFLFFSEKQGDLLRPQDCWWSWLLTMKRTSHSLILLDLLRLRS